MNRVVTHQSSWGEDQRGLQTGAEPKEGGGAQAGVKFFQKPMKKSFFVQKYVLEGNLGLFSLFRPLLDFFKLTIAKLKFSIFSGRLFNFFFQKNVVGMSKMFGTFSKKSTYKKAAGPK